MRRSGLTPSSVAPISACGATYNRSFAPAFSGNTCFASATYAPKKLLGSRIAPADNVSVFVALSVPCSEITSALVPSTLTRTSNPPSRKVPCMDSDLGCQSASYTSSAARRLRATGGDTRPVEDTFQPSGKRSTVTVSLPKAVPRKKTMSGICSRADASGAAWRASATGTAPSMKSARMNDRSFMMAEDITRPYRAARTAAAWFDRGAEGRIEVRGADRISWLQGLLTNDVAALRAGSGLLCGVPDATGSDALGRAGPRSRRRVLDGRFVRCARARARTSRDVHHLGGRRAAGRHREHGQDRCLRSRVPPRPSPRSRHRMGRRSSRRS